MRKLYGDADDGNPAYSAEIPREWKHSLLSSRGMETSVVELPRMEKSRRIPTEMKKKSLRETQTLRAGCNKAEPKNFAPPQTPFPGALDGQNLISWRWSLYIHLQTQFGEDRCTQFRVIVVIDPQTNPQTGPITIHCAAKLSAQCNKDALCCNAAVLHLRRQKKNQSATSFKSHLHVNQKSSTSFDIPKLSVVTYSLNVDCTC